MSAPSDLAIPHLVGHQWALDAIARQAEAAARAHAYLITGPAHVGRFTTALEIARLFLCPSTPACGDCRHCRLAVRRAHPDLRVLEIPPDRKNIPVKDVHDFVQGIALKPLEAAVKMYLIRGADDLAEEGANALLKTIEEPPAGVTLVLTATSPGSVLPTIVSRCQVINLHRVAAAEIAEHLAAARGLSSSDAARVAQASQGLPGWAILASDKATLVDERRERANDLLQVVRGDRLVRFRYADDLAEEWSGHADEVNDVLETWAEVWRDVLLWQEGLRERASHVAGEEETAGLANAIDAQAVRTALAQTIDVADSLGRNAHPRLALEAYMLLLPHAASPT